MVRFWISTKVMYLRRWHGLSYIIKLLPCRRVLCTPYNHAPCHFMQSHTLKTVHAYLTVTCHLHLWQNYRDLLRATAVTRGWSGMPATEISVSTESWPWRWNFSHRYCRFPFFSWFKNLFGISKNVIHCLAGLPHLRSLDPRPHWAIGFQHLLRQSSY